jgi:hypothetical protein
VLRDVLERTGAGVAVASLAVVGEHLLDELAGRRVRGALDDGAARRLAAMPVARLDAARAAAIKRNVHELDIDATPDRFAAALTDVLADPAAGFGLVEVRRARDRLGLGFNPGERFVGCFSVTRAAAAWRAPRWVRAVLGVAERAGILPWLEHRLTCDHAEIAELQLDPDAEGARRVVYRYLAGTPLAGDSAYTITPLGPRACRLEVAFTYQETTAAAVSLLHRFGIRQHDAAVLAQAEAAARRVGARVVRHTLRLPGGRQRIANQ